MSKLFKKLRRRKSSKHKLLSSDDETSSDNTIQLDPDFCLCDVNKNVKKIQLSCGDEICQLCLDEWVARCYSEGRLPSCPVCSIDL